MLQHRPAFRLCKYQTANVHLNGLPWNSESVFVQLSLATRQRNQKTWHQSRTVVHDTAARPTVKNRKQNKSEGWMDGWNILTLNNKCRWSQINLKFHLVFFSPHKRFQTPGFLFWYRTIQTSLNIAKCHLLVKVRLAPSSAAPVSARSLQVADGEKLDIESDWRAASGAGQEWPDKLG